jgi:hypothetical protein
MMWTRQSEICRSDYIVYTNSRVDWKHAGPDLRRLADGSYRVTGGHHLLDPDNIRIKSGTTPVVHPNGVIEAQIEMRIPNTTTWIDKQGDGMSTLFPSDWVPVKMNLEVNIAFANRSPIDNVGTSSSGIRIKFRFDNNLDIWRFFPLKD